MAYLSDEWKNNVAHPIYRGVKYHDNLLKRLETDPDLFKRFTTAEIAQTLRNLNRIIPDEMKFLVPLYSAFNVKANHRFRAWDFDRRIDLMTAINTDPVLNTENDPITLLKRYNELHAQAYGFKAETIIPINRPPSFFDNAGNRVPRKELSEYAPENLVEILSSGGHKNGKILINTYHPTEAGKNIPTFHKSPVEAAALILHEGRHSFMNQAAEKMHLIEDPEFRDVVTIHYLNTLGVYYLSGSDERNFTNPCEKDAYDFQKDMEAFLSASPEMKKTLIKIMAQRRDAHLEMAQSPPASGLKHMELAFAA